MNKLYRSFNTSLRERYGEKVWKVPVDAGFTCPNRDGKKGEGGCIYCDNSSFVMVSGSEIKEQVANRIRRLQKRNINKYIVYFQSYTNTYGSVELIKEKVESALVDDGIVAIHIGTRPDELDEERADYLASLTKKYDVTVELGLQSADDEILGRINRGHSAKDFSDAVTLCKDRNIEVCAHIIFGLPGESVEGMLNTVKFAVNCGIDSVKFHHMHVVKGTKLAEMYENKEFELLSEDEYIRILSEAITILPEDVVIARLVGDAPEELILGPFWLKNKNTFMQNLEKYMRGNKLYQGLKSVSTG